MRKEGFYWIKTRIGYEGWQSAHWWHNRWWIVATNINPKEDIKEINENRILNPDELEKK